MFTGLIREMAKVTSFTNNILTLKAKYKPKIGDSIAINGACLTAVSVNSGTFSVELSPESTKTLAMVNYKNEVHIEPAMMMGDRFEGHIVQGHIDCIGKIISIKSNGNSTDFFIKLPEKFIKYVIAKGSITIDGYDIRDVTLESLRKQIGIVSQQIMLFHDTIAGNISYGDPGKTMDEIIAAAKAGYAHDFIMGQPDGYQTIVGDQGDLLSGGQRQRIAISRAILIDPAILILDEAASALDAESEKFVQEAIERFQGKRTILVAAHRLSTVMKADCIYVLEAGRIVEHGTCDELLSLNGRFRHLYEIQFGENEK
jgi:riboflavin synthase alpha subunit